MQNSFLKSRIDKMQSLVDGLTTSYDALSILGKQTKTTYITLTNEMVNIMDPMDDMANHVGFVVKAIKDGLNHEVFVDDIDSLTCDQLKTLLNNSSQFNPVGLNWPQESPLILDKERLDEQPLSVETIVNRLKNMMTTLNGFDQRIFYKVLRASTRRVDAVYVSKNRFLQQSYDTNQTVIMLMAKQGDVQQEVFHGFSNVSMVQSLDQLEASLKENADTVIELLGATTVEPGLYDVILTPGISGLVAHEAFGHGVEMDMFVKNRAKAKDYIGKSVASPLVNMHDGAIPYVNSASYFFDDDGVEAHDTTIIENGILQTGIRDTVTAASLHITPSGNARRQSPRRKMYTRMTNTYFLPGHDKLEDMIKSIDHGYMLFDTNNGMEDPKNWQMQCTAQYGREIKNGQFTGKLISPVVMSGYVPDILNSISMVSDDFELDGVGSCGKGYKEWVYVSDGGPYLKAKVKLG